MPPRVHCFFAAILCTATAATGDEAPPPKKPTSIAREAIRDFKFKPTAAPAADQSPALKAPVASEPPVVVMAPYTVQALRERTFETIGESFAQHERLQTPALMHRGNLDLLRLPIIEPSPAGEPRLLLPIISLR